MSGFDRERREELIESDGNHKTRVLVIDDEAPIRLLCRVNLEAEDMVVLEAEDGPSGIEAARRELPDAILLDVMMPGLDGWQVAERLLEDPSMRDVPIVFLTARAEERDRQRAYRLGAVGYMTKPLDPVRLPDQLEEILQRLERGEREQLRAELLEDS